MATKVKATSRTKTVGKRGNVRGVNGKGRDTNRLDPTFTVKPASEAEKIVIRPPQLKTFKVTLKGKTPLIVHKFSEKSKKQIEGNQQHKPKEARGPRDPKAEYLAACYVMPGSKAGAKGCKYAITAVCIKASMISACRVIDGLPMTLARCVFHVLAEEGGLVPLKFKGTHPRMREDTIRLPNGSLDLRYRPEFTDWSVTVAIEYNAAVISAEQIVNLLAVAGFSCGLCELRPNSKSGPGGSNGTYGVQTA
ncbi:hypothetical protein LCGC14_0719220 [marine sediment metagenome]|uniref:Uncharacterized protein n=1 Tax=marine sediment metagenome TaxID=412755 RepID=A0A0F9QY25_9ZZZZ